MEMGVKRFGGWRNGWAKPDRRPIAEWAAQYLSLPPSYAVPGKFDVSATRPLEPIFDAIQNPAVRKIRFRKPPRFGGSLIADIAIPWICCNDPGPVMWNWQTDADAKAHMKEKVWALWRSCAPLRALFPQDRHDRTNTEIYFGPFFVVAQGANLSNLQSKGVRWMFNDEIWLPVWQELYHHAEARTRDFERAGNYKITDVSQAGNADDVEDRNWRAGHQALWHYRAGDGKRYPLLFGGKREDGSRWGLVWDDQAKKTDGGYDLARACESARYVCRATGEIWPDCAATQAAWNRDGEYRATREDAPADTLSFGVNALLNRSMASIVAEKIAALELARRGDMSSMKTYKQQVECLPWAETFLTVSISAKKSGYLLQDFAEGQKWTGEKIRCMMIDRQHGIGGDTPHRWVEIRAWQPGGDSRQLFFGRVDTAEACREYQKKYAVPDRCVWQDGAFEKHEVFGECVRFGWMAVFGSDQNSWAHYGRSANGETEKVTMPYSPIQSAEAGGGKAHYLYFSEDYMADILANLVAGRGAAWEQPDDGNPLYAEHLSAEHKVEKRPGVFTWEKIYSTKANHGWDTSKMAVAFACLMRLLTAQIKNQ